ncbi:MAG: 2-oxo-4-hydroxy-4-carboxy-5-ureidoimidazoline decarboxylase [Acidobacteriota bacterium]|nr:2-oxo-4-hydroxy-4-carboxy-5-ureidoimidazoline decarboxylase [Acidobacteriota bacterium]
MNWLDHLNSLPAAEAQLEFLKCCGSKNWAVWMAGQRPFAGVPELLSKADDNWRSLATSDWLEAFRSHPKIGEKKAEQAQSETARAWSEQEQAGTRDSALETMQALADGNHKYEKRFGYIFIICATGKTSEEILDKLRERLLNDPASELRNAAEEQRKITQLRLNKLAAGTGA